MATSFRRTCLVSLSLLLTAWASLAAQRPAQVVRQEIEQAAIEVPKLAELLDLKPGMTVADVGAGGGAMAVAMARWLGSSGHVYATDIGQPQLAEIRDLVAREGLSNVDVIEGAVSATNLPNSCCDAILMHDVYHHLTHPGDINESVAAALKARGRFAIIDFEPEAGSKIPEGVPENRGGHGIRPTLVVAEVTGSGFQHLSTGVARYTFFLVLFQKP
jgi:ubiquinone/menaquinone biosynthesis C-methylase UbiE